MLRDGEIRSPPSRATTARDQDAGEHPRVRGRPGANRARWPIAHSLLIAVWHMLTTGETYTTPATTTTPAPRTARTTRRLVAQIERLGHTVTLQESAAG